MPCKYELERHGSAEVVRFKCKYCQPRDLARRDCREGVFDVLAGCPSVFQVLFEDISTLRLNEAETKDLLELARGRKECLAREFWRDEKLAPKSDKGCEKCLEKRRRCAVSLKVFVQIHPILAAKLVDDVPKIFAGGESPRCRHCTEVVSREILGSFSRLKESGLVKRFLSPGPSGARFSDAELANTNIYRNMFGSVLRPFFITGFIAPEPQGLRKIDSIEIKSMKATLSFFEREDTPERLLTVDLPEFHLKPAEIALLNQVQQEIGDLAPKTLEFADPLRVSTFLENAIEGILAHKNATIPYETKKLYAEILDRYITKLGALTPLLHFDSGVQDVYIDTPSILSPVYVDHQTHETCATQIYMSRDDTDRIAMRLRALTGVRLDEGSPVLDGDFPSLGCRICALSSPALYEQKETGFAIRVHRHEPWNIPLEISKKFMSPLIGGILDFAIDAGGNVLIGGSKSTAKTSLLEALIQESPTYRRKVLVEDTPEVHTERLKQLGFKIQRLRVRSLLEELREQGSSKLSHKEGTATGLRLGDSDFIMGEVREREAALSLFEAFAYEQSRSVMATMHFHNAMMSMERLKKWEIDPADLKLVDFIISSGIVYSGERTQKYRRLREIAEVSTDWRGGAGGIKPIVVHDSRSDSWRTTFLKANGRVLKQLNQPIWPKGFDVRDVWEKVGLGNQERISRLADRRGLTDDDVVKTILARAQVKNDICLAGQENPRLMESSFYVPALNRFRAILDKGEEYGTALETWHVWLKRARA